MAEPVVNVLAVVGSLHRESVSRSVIKYASDRLRAAGCAVDVLDFEKEPLALYNPDVAYDLPGFAELQARVAKGFGHDLPSPFYRMLHKKFVRAEL